jgi:protein-S-isoprenylcysteine O-methyltransferase Ste14
MWLISLQFSGIPSPIQIKLMTFVALAGIGAFFFVASGMSFIKAKTTVNPMTPDETSSLVTSGIYKHTRNPMYLGCLFILIGWGLFLSNLYSLALSVGFVPYMNRFQILPEERALESIFGAEFLAYKERVRRWL